MTRQRRDRLLFYVIFTYILASFLWWAILFLRNNRQTFTADAARYEKLWVADGRESEDWANSATYQELSAELRKKNMMIIGEGLVFMALISLGFYKIDRSFRREVELTRQQNNFILSITHELKSPLASIKLSMQTLLKRRLERDKVERIAGMCLEDTERLEGLVENILMASRLESPDHRFHKEWVDLSAMTRELTGSLSRKYPESKLNPDIQDGIELHGDPMALSSVVINLVENAIKYGPINEEIRIRLSSDHKEIRLKVEDRGPGIPASDVKRVFHRFYRAGNEETRASKGTGLGLFIVHEIVRAHGGSIHLGQNSPHGAVFTVIWPRDAVETPEELEEGHSETSQSPDKWEEMSTQRSA